MNARRLLVAASLASIAGCADRTTAPVTPSVDAQPRAAVAAARPSSLLSAIPVTGVIPGGTFSGLLNVTSLALQNGQLVASGVLTGTSTVGGVVTQITQTFTNVPLGLLGSGGGQGGGGCKVLTLDLGPLHLDLLGLVVDLAPVNLDITAQPGPGNLLGNLLCAVTHLLDVGSLAGILNILNQINAILGALG